MKNLSLKQEQEILQKKSRKVVWTRIVTVLACIVVFCTTYALILPAITMEKDPTCGYEEHVHNEDCYTTVKVCPYGEDTDQIGDKVLICGLEEGDVSVPELICGLEESVHEHTDDCYTVEKALICETEEHIHGEACYNEAGELVCELPEHTHGEDCYSENRILVCTETGHVHDASCYAEAEEAHAHTDECYHVHTEECFCQSLICELPEHEHTADCYLSQKPEVEQQVEADPSEESSEEPSKALDLSDLTTIQCTTEDGVTVTLTGNLPEGAAIQLSELSQDVIDDILAQSGADSILFAYDVTIVDGDGNEWQPDELGATVEITGLELPEKDDVEVVHMPNDGDIEKLESSLTDEGVIFVAESFSPIAVVTRAQQTPIPSTAPANAGTHESGKLKIKVNLYDADASGKSVSIPYGDIGFTRRSKAGTVSSKENIIKLTTGADGSAYIELPLTINGNKAYIGSEIIFDKSLYTKEPGSTDFVYTEFPLRLDVGPINNGYGFVNPLVSGRVRNVIMGANCGVTNRPHRSSPSLDATKLPANEYASGQLIYDDLIFHQGILTSGAATEIDVYVRRTNKANHTVHFDTSELSNGSSFPDIQVADGGTISLPEVEPINRNNSEINCIYWVVDGEQDVEFFEAAPIYHDITLKPKWADACTITFDTTGMTNGTDPAFASQTILQGRYATAPTVTPTGSRTFLYWALNGVQFDFANTPILSDITLTPVWNVQGVIHYQVYMWDHDAYWANPTYATIAGPESYTTEQYRRSSGWTEIPISDLDFVIKAYKDVGEVQDPNGGVPDYVKIPLKPSSSSDRFENSTITTDENGYATYTLNSAELQALAAQFQSGVSYRIDTDPVKTDFAFYNRNKGYGVEKTLFDWDLILESSSGAQAGLVGVRKIPEGRRQNDHPTITISDLNVNDDMLITQKDLEEGFEFTFVCYVVPACIVEFDLDGGKTETNADTYETQIFDPADSMNGVTSPIYMATNPGTPHKTDKVFAGWYEVIYDTDGSELGIADHKYNFTRPVTYSRTLRATWEDRSYEVRWADAGWNKSTDAVPPLLERNLNNANNTYPTYDNALPKWNNTNTVYLWAFYEEVKDPSYEAQSSDIVLSGKRYKYVENVLQSSFTTKTDPVFGDTYYVSPKKINQANQIYIAQYVYTVRWVDWNWTLAGEPTGLIEKDENVVYGATAHFDGTEPTRAGDDTYTYTFIGWKMISPIEGSVFTGRNGSTVGNDQVYQAQYNKTYKNYTITWVNDDGTTVLDTETTYHYGDTPSYKHGTPTSTKTPPNENQYYHFVGWTPTISPVTGDKIYEAVYELLGTDRQITVTKTIEGTSETLVFNFQAVITDSSNNPVNMSGKVPSGMSLKTGTTNTILFSLDNNGNNSKTIGQIPYGSNVAVSELNGTGYTVKTKVNGANEQTGTSTRSASNLTSDVTFAFTNTLNVNKLTVTKTVSGEDTTGIFPFTVTVSGTTLDLSKITGMPSGCTVNGKVISFNLAHSGSIEIPLPSGCSFTVKETSHSGYTTTVNSSETDTYTCNPFTANVTAAYVNTVIDAFDLTVSKTVTGATTSESFPFELTVKNSDNTVADFSSVTLPSGVTLKTGTSNVLCFNLANGGSIALSDILPADAKLTLKETSHNGYNVSMTVGSTTSNGDSQNFVLSEDMSIAVTNEAGTALPSTGGHGTMLYTLSGILCLAIACGTWFMLRRGKEGRAE